MARAFSVAVLLAIFAGLPGPTVADSKPLGWLSAKHEVGDRGPGEISSGIFKVKDKETGEVAEVVDKGGKSYGSYQLASKRGLGGSSAAAFVQEFYPEDFRVADPAKAGTFRSLEP